MNMYDHDEHIHTYEQLLLLSPIIRTENPATYILVSNRGHSEVIFCHSNLNTFNLPCGKLSFRKLNSE